MHKKSLERFHNNHVMLTAGLIVALCLLGGASYGTHYYTTNQASGSKTKDVATVARANEIELKKDLSEIDKDIKKVKEATAPKTISEPEQYKRNEDGLTPMTGAGCAGIACYSLGGFSIVASPKNLTLHPGENSGPILVKTTDGSKVDWGGMPEDAGMVGSFAQTFPGHSKSFEYYASAGDDAKPGTYHLEFYATKEKNKQWAKTTVTVKIVAPES